MVRASLPMLGNTLADRLLIAPDNDRVDQSIRAAGIGLEDRTLFAMLMIFGPVSLLPLRALMKRRHLRWNPR